MWGEWFFHTRDQLMDCRRRIDGLAAEIGLPEHVADDESAEELNRPWLGLVVGETNAGKSALINALAGMRVAEVSPLPDTVHVTVYVGAGQAAPSGWETKAFSAPGLERIGWIDTPGLDGKSREELFGLLPVLGAVDMILAVFSVENPWAAVTWQWVSLLPEEMLDRTALVVQMTDRKAAADMEVIGTHMRDLSGQKVGRVLPLLAVAAEPAEGGPRVEETEAMFEQKMCSDPGRVHLMNRCFQDAFRWMRTLEDELDRLRREFSDDSWFLERLENECGQLCQRVSGEARPIRRGEREAYLAVVTQVCRKIGRGMGFWGTLKGLLWGDAPGVRMEARLISRLEKMVDQFSERDFQRLASECQAHWDGMRPRIDDHMQLDPGEQSPVERKEAEGPTPREIFVARMRRVVPEFLGLLRLRTMGNDLARKRADALRGWVAAWLVAVSLLGLCGTLRWEPWTRWLGLLSSLGAVLLLIAGWLTRRVITNQIKTHLKDSRDRFDLALGHRHEDAMLHLFERYRQGLIPVRRQLAARQARIGPLAEKWNLLYLELKGIEQGWQRD